MIEQAAAVFGLACIVLAPVAPYLVSTLRRKRSNKPRNKPRNEPTTSRGEVVPVPGESFELRDWMRARLDKRDQEIAEARRVADAWSKDAYRAQAECHRLWRMVREKDEERQGLVLVIEGLEGAQDMHRRAIRDKDQEIARLTAGLLADKAATEPLKPGDLVKINTDARPDLWSASCWTDPWVHWYGIEQSLLSETFVFQGQATAGDAWIRLSPTALFDVPFEALERV